MSQKLNDEFKNTNIEINETDFFIWYLQKNFWAKGIGYDEVKEQMLKQGIKIKENK